MEKQIYITEEEKVWRLAVPGALFFVLSQVHGKLLLLFWTSCPKVDGSIFSCLCALLATVSKSRYSVVCDEFSSCPVTSPQSKTSSTTVPGVSFLRGLRALP